MSRNDSQLGEILNNQLTPELLPLAAASWREISRFALTFPAYAHFPGPELEQVAKSVAAAFQDGSDLGMFTMSDLRACLFWKQRYYRWMDRQPDEEEMKCIRALLEALRSKVAAWS
jgi:hypothetical protein